MSDYLYTHRTYVRQESTTKRLLITQALTNMFRSLLVLSPSVRLATAARHACLRSPRPRLREPNAFL